MPILRAWPCVLLYITAWICVSLCPYACLAAQSESITVTVTVDGIPPTNPTILIEDDETYTNSLEVSLSLGAEDASHMIISQDPDFNDAQWQTFTTSVSFGLSSDDGAETVYVKYKDEVGNQTGTVSDSIILDTTPPAAVVVIDDGENTPNNTQLHATWTESNDVTSGIEEYQYAIGTSSGSTDVVDWTSAGLNTEVTHTGLSLLHGPLYYISVCVLDYAGNISAIATSDGIADGFPPEINNITLANDQNFHQGWPVTIQVDATDPEGDTIEYRYLVNGQEVQGWTTQPQVPWNSLAGNIGLSNIRIEVRAPRETGTPEEKQLYLFRKPITPTE